MARSEFTPEEAAAVANTLGVDFARERIDIDEYRRGMNVELEHGA